MTGYDRDAAVDRVETLLETVQTDLLPVPIREVWVYGDLALGLDPVDRLDVYLTKDMLRSPDAEASDQSEDFAVEGIGRTVSAVWADQYPEYVRTNASGHVAPEKCLAAHLLEEAEPIHLEICNSSFEFNVRQRLEGALAREAYEQILDPRGVCLWLDDESTPSDASQGQGDEETASPDTPRGRRDEEAIAKLRDGSLAFPTLAQSLELLGADAPVAERAADAVRTYRNRQDGATVRGDVV
jgi:hypothetical protein